MLRTMAVDADGSAVLILRYVAPTPPPPMYAAQLRMAMQGGDATKELIMLRLARFVAHVRGALLYQPCQDKPVGHVNGLSLAQCCPPYHTDHASYPALVAPQELPFIFQLF